MTQRGKLCFPTSPFDIQCLAVDITLRGGQTRFYSWGYEILRIHECRISYFVFLLRLPAAGRYFVLGTLYLVK